MQRRIPILGLPILLFAFASAAFAQRPALPTPEQFLGFRVGTNRKLARWDQVLEYMQRVSRSSPRVRYEELGKSTLGNSFPMLTISSPRNLERLKEIQAVQKQLAYPYKLGDVQADELIRKNPLVVLVTCTIHSNEIGSTQMCLELVHELATDNSPRVREILDNVVFLLVPSANPDGQVLVVDWYQRNVGTPYEHAPLPFLYHPYTGHDDNRDAYMLTQIETRLITRVLYRDWFPMVYLDEHQMGSNGARIFVPPFADPVNPNQDPLVIAATSQIGMQLFTALNAAGLEGAKYGEDFTWWWQGSAKNGAWYHNMLGLLTEVASSRLASPIEQQRAGSGRNPADADVSNETSAADPRRPLPAPRDTWARANYPKPWRGGTWTLRNIIDYELVITRALLEHCAQQRETYQRYFHRLNRKAIAAGRKGDPAAYVLPAEQRDPGAATRLLDVLDQAGIEIYQARAPFSADGVSYAAGSWVIPMAQPFRNYAKDLLEPQDYPMRPARSGQVPERPYDVTGWTLPLQMGVRAIEIKSPFSAPLTRVQPIPPPEGKVGGEGTAAYLVPRAWNAGATLVNRLLAGNPRAAWEAAAADESFTAAGRDWPAGTLVLTPRTPGPAAADELARVAREVHVAPTALLEAPHVPKTPIAPPRLALYQPFTANMDEGWTRWLLEQYGFRYTIVRNADLRAGRLRERFDAILFASQSRTSLLNGNQGEWHRPEHRGGIGTEGVQALAEFVQEGGTMVTLDAACDFAIQELRLPVRNVLRGLSPSRFYCPGAILGVTVDNRHPLAYGMAEQASAYFLNSAAFELLPEQKDAVAKVVVRYPPGNPLQSGWIGGPDHLRDRAAVVEVTRGMGKVVLLGFRVQFRAQPNGTFPLLFNALFGAASGGAGDPRGVARPAPVPIPAARARASAPPPG